MEQALYTLAEISVYAAILLLSILLLRALLHRYISPRLQYLLWSILLIRLLLPVTLESGFHVEDFLPERPAQAVQAVLQPAGASEAEPATPFAAAAPIPHGGAAAQAVSASSTHDWTSILFWTWIAGVAASVTFTAVSRFRFGRRLQRSAVRSAREARLLLGGCKEALGIRGDVRLLTTTLPISPALTLLCGKSVLILPHTLTDMPALRYAILHELAHYQRRDHLTLALLTLLNCVYWFHPLLWLGFSEMRADMETACDARVLALLAPKEKRSYLSALLSMFSAAPHSAPGMALSQTKRIAKKRLKGAFMKPKTSKSALVAVTLVALLMLVGCFTTACQPAPGNPAASLPEPALSSSAPAVRSDGGETFTVADNAGRSVSVTYHDMGADKHSAAQAPVDSSQVISVREAAFAAAQMLMRVYGEELTDNDLYIFFHNYDGQMEQYRFHYGDADYGRARYFGRMDAATGAVLAVEDIDGSRPQETDDTPDWEDPIWEAATAAALERAKTFVLERFPEQGAILDDSEYGGVQATFNLDDPICVDNFIHMETGPSYMLRILYPSMRIVWLWSFPLGWEYCKQQVWTEADLASAIAEMAAAAQTPEPPELRNNEISLEEYALLARTAKSLVGEDMTGRFEMSADGGPSNTVAFVRYVQQLAGVTVEGVGPLVISSADDPALLAGRTLGMTSSDGYFEAVFVGGNLYVMMNHETNVVEARSISHALNDGAYTQIEVRELYGTNVTGV